jgi:hypothetical protein
MPIPSGSRGGRRARRVRRQRDAVAAEPLGRVETAVSGLGDRVQRPSAAHGADRDRLLDLDLAGHERTRAHRLAQTLATRLQLVVGAHAGQQHRELLTAPAAEAVVGAERAAQPRRQLDEHGVADRVPVGVVDLLEMVGVKQREAVRALGQGGFRQLREVRAIMDAGEHVGACAAAQLVLEPAALGDVAADAVVEQRAVGLAARAHALVHDPLAPVDAAQPVFELDRLAERQPGGEGAPAGQVVGMQERVPGLLVPGEAPAEQRLAVWPAIDDVVAVLVDPHCEQVVVHRLDHARHRGVGLGELGAHAAPFGDVGDDAADLDHAVVTPARGGAVVDPAGHAVGAAQPVLHLRRLAAAQARVERVVGGAVVGM